jgi:phospholipase C
MSHPEIEHVVLLFFENRSFDHIFGFLPHPGRLTGRESNPVDPANPSLGRARVNKRAEFVAGPDPHHDLLSVNLQLFGYGPLTADPAPMSGFVRSHTDAAGGDVPVGKTIMKCFDPRRLPALGALAREYCFCDRWFSSVPGPTWPNRFFVHAATSDGVVTNDVFHPFEMETIFNRLDARGLTWNVYYHDFPHTLSLRRLWGRRDRFRKYSEFAVDIQRGLLPNYSFIEPRYFELLGWRANDFHPPHDVRYGDDLVADVYGLLRNSPAWEKSLLIVSFDEHGGYFDRVSPPRGVPNPDNQVSTDPPFDFTRLGLRVPAVIAAPWIDKGRIDSTVYEHASVPATLSKLFGLNSFLTARDRAACTFQGLLSRATPREDAPSRLPTARRPLEPGLLALEAVPPPAPLSEFQESLVQLADLLAEGQPHRPGELGVAPDALVADEQQAAVYVQAQLSRFFR